MLFITICIKCIIDVLLFLEFIIMSTEARDLLDCILARGVQAVLNVDQLPIMEVDQSAVKEAYNGMAFADRLLFKTRVNRYVMAFQSDPKTLEGCLRLKMLKDIQCAIGIK